MDVLVVGLNHKTAPLEIRERLAVPPTKTFELLKALEARRIFKERLLLSTCNRTELYGVGAGEETVRRAKDFLSEFSRTDIRLFEDKLYVLRQPDSVKHLFSVASGLDSMVIGETEITGQVKEAYLSALKFRQTGKVLNALFQRSLKVAKRVRTHTDVGTGRVSVASVAVELAQRIFENLKGVRFMLIGTGEMSIQIMKSLTTKGAQAMIVSSRHHERAERLAEEFAAAAVPFERYADWINEVDILVTSTLCPQVLIHEENVRAWMRLRHGRPLFLVDIAMPRNIDPSAERIDNVYLYNLDDLKNISDQNRAHREGELEKCFDFIGSQTQFFMEWLKKAG